MAVFADIKYCIYADIMGGSKTVQKYADVMWDGPKGCSIFPRFLFCKTRS